MSALAKSSSMSYGYVHQKCAKCDVEGSISISDIIKDNNALGIPKNWLCRYCGEWGEDCFMICANCKVEYEKLEKKAFMDFVKNK